MGLSCSCNDGDDERMFYFCPNDYIKFQRARRVRCCSCKELIDVGAICTKFQRYRSPLYDIEQRIYGDEVELSEKFMCETCSDLYFSLDELGFCYNLGDNVHKLVKEYAETYQP